MASQEEPKDLLRDEQAAQKRKNKGEESKKQGCFFRNFNFQWTVKDIIETVAMGKIKSSYEKTDKEIGQ